MKKRIRLIIDATTKKNKLPTRIFLAAFGVLIMGFGMSVIEKLNFGTDPYTCLNNGLSMKTGISLGTWGLIISAVIAVFVVIFGSEKIGLGTLFNMVGFGYFVADNGNVYYEVMYNYMDLEFYTGPYKANERILPAVSRFVKGEIGLDFLLRIQRRLLVDMQLDGIWLENWPSNGLLEEIGLA